MSGGYSGGYSGGSVGGGFSGGNTGGGGGTVVTHTNQVATNQVVYVQQKECTAMKLCMETCETGYQLSEVGSNGCQDCYCPPKKTYVYGMLYIYVCFF